MRAPAVSHKLPPEPPTEFQRFVGSTIGQVLPIYGASLFASVPSTFAPLDMTPVPPDYVLGPGDELPPLAKNRAGLVCIQGTVGPRSVEVIRVEPR